MGSMNGKGITSSDAAGSVDSIGNFHISSGHTLVSTVMYSLICSVSSHELVQTVQDRSSHAAHLATPGLANAPEPSTGLANAKAETEKPRTAPNGLKSGR